MPTRIAPFLDVARIFGSCLDLFLENVSLRQQLGVLGQRYPQPQWVYPEIYVLSSCRKTAKPETWIPRVALAVGCTKMATIQTSE